jgi:hypothetical protein
MKETAIQYIERMYNNSPEMELTDEDFKKAKEIEKENIQSSFTTGMVFSDDYFNPNSDKSESEIYYDRTFSNEPYSNKSGRVS